MRVLKAILIATALAACAGPVAAQNSTSQPLQVLTALNSCATLNVLGMGSVTYDITGTFTATVTFYSQGLGGTRDELDVSTSQDPGTMVNTATAAGKLSGALRGENVALACITS